MKLEREGGAGGGLARGQEGHTSRGRCGPLWVETVEEARQRTRCRRVHAGSRVCANARAPAPGCVRMALDTPQRDDRGHEQAVAWGPNASRGLTRLKPRIEPC